MENRKMSLLEQCEYLSKSLASVREDQEGFARNVTTNFAKIIDLVNSVVETCKVMDPTFGDKLQAQVEKTIQRRNEEFLANKKAQVQALVKAGTLKPSDKITETSFLIAREFDKDGKLTHPFLQNLFQEMFPEVRAKLLGQAPGFILEQFEDGKPDQLKGKFEILEVYEVVQSPAK